MCLFYLRGTNSIADSHIFLYLIILVATDIYTVDSRSNVFQGSDLNLPLEPKNAIAIPWLSRKNNAGKANDAEWIWDIGYRICSADHILASICWDGPRSYGQTDWWTDKPMDREMDIPSYRDAKAQEIMQESQINGITNTLIKEG